MDSSKPDDRTVVLQLWELARRTGMLDQEKFSQGLGRIADAGPGACDPEAFLSRQGIPEEQVARLVSMADSGSASAQGQRFGKYVVTGELGAGGMGAVFKARDEELGRTVALKVLRAGAALLPGGAIDRFHVEARALAKVMHPNIVLVYESGQVDGQPYLALEYVEGGSLVSRDYSKMDTTRKLQIARDIARALEHAHAHGLVHRDVKPSNILVRSDEQAGSAGGAAVLTDFGLVRDDATTVRLTQSVAWLGTPAYMSPEQAEGYTPRIDHRTDVYSLGVVLYEMLAGRLPFEDLSVSTLRDRIVKEEVMPLSRRVKGVPREVEAVVMKALERRPAERYQTAGAFGADLERLLGGETPSVRPPRLVRRLWLRARTRPLVTAGVGVAMVLAGVAGALLVRPARGGIQEAQARTAVAIEAALQVHTTALRAAATRLNVPRVSAALETLQKGGGMSIEAARAEVETEMESAARTEPLLREEAVIVLAASKEVLLPGHPSEVHSRVIGSVSIQPLPTEGLIDDGSGPWLYVAQPIAYPGTDEIGGWAVVGDRPAPSWFRGASEGCGSAFAWVLAPSRVFPASGISREDAGRIAALAAAGETHAELGGHACAITLRGRPDRRVVVAVPDPPWRRWAAIGFAAVAVLGCVAIGLAGFAAREAARYAARARRDPSSSPPHAQGA